jgi:hypothetical protein
MTGGPARLDLLIPLAKPHGHGSNAQQSFEELMRKDEHATHASPRLPNGEPVRRESATASRSHAAPIQIAAAEADCDEHEPLVVHETEHEAKLERLYGVHLMAGGYLSLKAIEEDASGHGTGSIPAGDFPYLVSADTPDAIDPRIAAYAGGGPVSEACEENPSLEGTAAVSHMTDEAEAAPFLHAQDDIEGATPASPVWLAQMERLSISSEGIVTIWIRDFAADGDDLTERVAEICRRVASEGRQVGVVMVNGHPWTHSHQGKESDA